jgi:hypothetical protein
MWLWTVLLVVLGAGLSFAAAVAGAAIFWQLLVIVVLAFSGVLTTIGNGFERARPDAMATVDEWVTNSMPGEKTAESNSAYVLFVSSALTFSMGGTILLTWAALGSHVTAITTTWVLLLGYDAVLYLVADRMGYLSVPGRYELNDGVREQPGVIRPFIYALATGGGTKIQTDSADSTPGPSEDSTPDQPDASVAVQDGEPTPSPQPAQTPADPSGPTPDSPNDVTSNSTFAPDSTVYREESIPAEPEMPPQEADPEHADSPPSGDDSPDRGNTRGDAHHEPDNRSWRGGRRRGRGQSTGRGEDSS